jgi:hypothetical protein
VATKYSFHKQSWCRVLIHGTNSRIMTACQLQPLLLAAADNWAPSGDASQTDTGHRVTSFRSPCGRIRPRPKPRLVQSCRTGSLCWCPNDVVRGLQCPSGLRRGHPFMVAYFVLHAVNICHFPLGEMLFQTRQDLVGGRSMNIAIFSYGSHLWLCPAIDHVICRNLQDMVSCSHTVMFYTINPNKCNI